MYFLTGRISHYTSFCKNIPQINLGLVAIFGMMKLMEVLMETRMIQGKKRLSPWRILGITLGLVLLALVFCYTLRILATELL